METKRGQQSSEFFTVAELAFHFMDLFRIEKQCAELSFTLLALIFVDWHTWPAAFSPSFFVLDICCIYILRY